jgi:hypothetical protein
MDLARGKKLFVSPLKGHLFLRFLLFLILIGPDLIVLLANPVHAAEWRPMLETSDGIQIFKNDATESGLIEFRGVGIVDAPLPLVATVIFDAARRLQWIKGLIESKIVRWEGQDSFIEYDHIDMPTFFTDRDFVSKVSIRTDRAGREVVFQFRPADDPAAPRAGYLRGEVINMTFSLRSVDHDTLTKVDAVFLCDPKGWIPAWLVNFFLKDWPKTTFRNLRREILRPGITVDPRFSALLGPEGD